MENKERGREPVIVTEAGHFQHNGICLENLQDIGGGPFCLLTGPAIDFDSWETWHESGLTWAEMIQAMRARGEIYKIVG